MLNHVLFSELDGGGRRDCVGMCGTSTFSGLMEDSGHSGKHSKVTFLSLEKYFQCKNVHNQQNTRGDVLWEQGLFQFFSSVFIIFVSF